MGFLQQVAVFEENAKQQEASNTVQNNSEKSNTVGLLKRIIRMNEKNRLRNILLYSQGKVLRVS